MNIRLDRRRFLAGVAAASTSSAFARFAYSASPQQAGEVKPWHESGQIEFGVDYYPEDWPEERWEIDARMMAQAHFRIVRVADTNWERMEPEEGRYDFAWLDRIVEVMSRNGIRVVLCTSSYAPPAWLSQKHPQIYSVMESGEHHRWGGLGYMCLNHPIYLQYVVRLVTALGQHFGRSTGVIGWQIDNELGGWGAECYDSQYCVPKFRKYLKDKFGTLDELNRRLFTVSYGHTYNSWDQIPLRQNVDGDVLQAPLVLEAERFFSGNIAEFLALQADILRKTTQGQFISHNGPDSTRNCFEFSKPLDFLCEDNYPRVGEFESPRFSTDLSRGFNHGKTFIVMEIRSGTYGGYTLSDATPPPGLARLWAWQTLAHGADGVLFFRWRMNNGGSEQYWQGLLNYDGSTSPAMPEVIRMGEEVQRVGSEFVYAESPAKVAGILSYDSLFALRIGDKFPYFDQLRQVSDGFHHWGLNVDFVEPESDLRKYEVVFAPSLHVLNKAIVDKLDEFVRGGGVLILTARTGFKNEDNLTTQVAPGPLRSMAGASVKIFSTIGQAADDKWQDFPIEQGAYRPSGDNAIVSESEEWPGEYQCKAWADVLELEGATSLFHYKKDFYSGQPAASIANYHQGKVIYVGTLLEPRFYVDLARHACKWANLETGPEIPPGMDFAIRRKGDREFLFLLNFGSDAGEVRISGQTRDLLSGKTFTDQVTVQPLDLCVLVR